MIKPFGDVCCRCRLRSAVYFAALGFVVAPTGASVTVTKRVAVVSAAARWRRFRNHRSAAGRSWTIEARKFKRLDSTIFSLDVRISFTPDANAHLEARMRRCVGGVKGWFRGRLRLLCTGSSWTSPKPRRTVKTDRNNRNYRLCVTSRVVCHGQRTSIAVRRFRSGSGYNSKCVLADDTCISRGAER